MTTISIKEELHFDRTSFDTLEEFQHYILLQQIEQPLSYEHKKIINDRVAEADANPDNYLTLDEVKKQLQKKRNV